MKSNHLTDEQMGELLCDPVGDPAGNPLWDSKRRAEAEHLKVCASCAEEFESLLAVMVDLREAAKASAEQHRRAARLPEPLFHMPRMAFAGLAATAILCIAGPLAVHHKPTRIAGANASIQQTQAAVSDAQLLSDVQTDVSSQVPQAMLPLAASVASSGAITSTSNSN